jgi:hypothetical protein
MNNYERSLEAIRIKNGGILPSGLYMKTNAELGKILYNLTGDFKYKCPMRVSKESLVKKIEKLTAVKENVKPPVQFVKRKLEDNTIDAVDEKSNNITTTTSSTNTIEKVSSSVTNVKKPRNVLPSLSVVQIVEMKRTLAITPCQLLELKHEKDLRPLWHHIGMTAQYPHMTGKEKIMDRLKAFATANLEFHNLL